MQNRKTGKSYSVRTLLVIFTLLTALLPATVKKEACTYYLSIGAIFRDEAPYLKEWIEFHRLVGVEHFYLYNNSSVDGYLSILSPYIQAGVVDLLDWPSTPEQYVEEQKLAYRHCIQKREGETFWLALVDIDEFIAPVDTPSVPSYLAQFDDEKYLGAVQINWQLYGTSFLAKLPQDRLMIESLIWKAPWDYHTKSRPDNTVFKSIVRPHAVKEYRIHEGALKEKFYPLPKNKFKLFQQPVQIEHLRINHYWTRAEDFFYDVKINRRMMFRDDDYLKVILRKLGELNQVEDTIMYRFVPELKKKMEGSDL